MQATGISLTADKRGHYFSQNLLARSLNEQAYDHNPGFMKFIEESGLAFQAHAEFKKADLDARQALYQKLAEQIWSPDRLALEAQSSSAAPTTSVEVRERMVEALKLDLVGPLAGSPLASEKLPGWIRPSNWYLTGFLIPVGTPPEKSADADEDDDADVIPETAGLLEESNDDRKAAKKGYFPSSMGLSFLVAKEARSITVLVRWGDYTPAEIEGADGKPAIDIWQRQACERSVPITLKGVNNEDVHNVPNSGGLQFHLVERLITAGDLDGHIPQGTRSVSVFLVNHRKPMDINPDLAFVFQAEIEVRSEYPFVPRPDLRGAQAAEWDEQVADLHYADTPEYATGHGVSAEWDIMDGECRLLRSAWIPSAEVEKTETVPMPGVELSMDALGALADGAATETALQPLVEKYRTWIESQRLTITALHGVRRETAEELLRLAGIAADRIEKGITLLAKDADALDAFRVANRSVGRALRKRLGIENPKWWAFQLAFILLNLPGLADPSDPNRATVDLLFFPTAGGKTEAYLGLAAFAMVLRRLRHPGDKGRAGAGVSVIMRYTLRLLTLDQLSRAAGLVCALELERGQRVDRYGEWPFEIGLWVGKAATPNILGRVGDGRSDSARAKVRQFKADPKGKPSPIPLENCPWCGARFKPESFTLLPNDDHPHELKIVCANFECDFTRDRPLPIVAVDEPLYRRLPAFLIATVDKFASLPWVGEAGALLGGAERYDGTGFYGGADPGRGMRLATPLPPPDLVVQDELHLISGPLGTMVGLYEAAIEALCLREIDGRAVRPKIVASTATVRRAQDQIQALFARPLTQVFPPPGPNRRDSFFATTVPSSQTAARLYLGVAAQGRNPKVIMRKAWLALMGAGERAYRDAGGHKNEQNPADPYMTVLGYFNSLRELGGARRILEEEVQNTIKGYGGAQADRRRARALPGPQELLRGGRTHLARFYRQSGRSAPPARSPIPQDRSTSGLRDCNEHDLGGPRYSASRPDGRIWPTENTRRVHPGHQPCGPDDQRPGLVVTLLNIHKPRDRSHYERFRYYHETFYRSVEVSSVTPFAARALDRGFAGALVGLARHAVPHADSAAGSSVDHECAVSARSPAPRCLPYRVDQQPFADEAEREECLRSVQNRVVDLLDSWRRIFDDYHADGVQMQYQKYELKQPRPLLREMLDKSFESDHHRKFSSKSLASRRGA